MMNLSSYMGVTSEEQKQIEKEFTAECLDLYNECVNGPITAASTSRNGYYKP
jgi:hypothetical protein